MQIAQSAKKRLVVAKDRVREVAASGDFYADSDAMRPPNGPDFYADSDAMRPPSAPGFYGDSDAMRPPNGPR
jgi:hypothetical protein